MSDSLKKIKIQTTHEIRSKKKMMKKTKRKNENTMEKIRETAIGDKVGDQKLLLSSVIEGGQREEIRVRQSPDLLHVIVELLFPNVAHVPEPLHHHRATTRQNRLVRRSESAAPENLRRSSKHVLKRELLPIITHEVQLALISWLLQRRGVNHFSLHGFVGKFPVDLRVRRGF